jgi:hypothetical protein
MNQHKQVRLAMYVCLEHIDIAYEAKMALLSAATAAA